MADKPTLDDIPERVARGVALLDVMQPGWDQLIDLEALDLGSCTACIIGQVYAVDHASSEWPFLSAAEHLAGQDLGPLLFNAPVLVEHGFTVVKPIDDEDPEDEFAALDAEWARIVRERRGSAEIPSGGES
jgi:hypothetical protein